MATEAEIARAQLLLGDTGRWSDEVVGATIDSEGGVPEACVLLLESAATAAAFSPATIKAGSQSISQANVADALRKAAQAIRDEYELAGSAGSVSTMQGWTGRDPLGRAIVDYDSDGTPDYPVDDGWPIP